MLTHVTILPLRGMHLVSTLTFGVTLKCKGLIMDFQDTKLSNLVEVASITFKTFGTLGTTNLFKQLKMLRDSN